jgi:YfiR/HmsC-like
MPSPIHTQQGMRLRGALSAAGGWRSWRRLLTGFPLLMLAVLAPAQILEYQVKAGFLFNFAKFVEWPVAILPPEAPLVIGLIAPNDVCLTIEQALAGKVVTGHPIVVKRLEANRLVPPPQILFVQRDATVPLESLLQLLGAEPVLIVGDANEFAPTGGTIGFILRGDSLRFQVNLVAAKNARLNLNSQLASLAEIVKPRP